MNVISVPIEEIKTYENNPRKIPEEAVNALAASIKEFGFRKPMILDKDNVIVAGHTRLLAAKQLGLSEVPCIIADDLTPEQVKAFRLVDNKTGELTGWDFEKLDLELEELESFDVDMSEFGFGDIESKQNYIEDMLNGFDGSERHSDNEYFSMTFTIDNGYKDKFDTYVKENGKDALLNVLIDEVSRIA